MKTYFNTFMRAAALSLVAAAMTGLASCRQDEEPARPEDTPCTYTLDIPATMGDDATRAVAFDGNSNTCTATFTALERVYVYNTSTDEVMTGFLSPKDITADSTGCHLTGTLSGGTISAGDALMLLYNLSSVNTDKNGDNHKWGSYFNYTVQDGTAGGVVDGATATVTVEGYTSGGELTTTAATFQSVQSMFRFQFEDEDGNLISVQSLIIHSGNNALAKQYCPLVSSYNPDDITVSRGSATTDPLYCSLCIDENNSDGDKLAFMVEDGAGKSHFAWKEAPSGGFKNGKYYYNSSPIRLGNAPTITWTNPGSPVFPEDNKCFNIDEEDYDITLSGTSNDFRFHTHNDSGTFRFHNLTATIGEQPFINADNFNLTLEISGDNTIITEYYYALEHISELKLCGNGTLTIACKSDRYYGIYSSNYNGDLDAIAAEGYTVTRSDRFNYNRKSAWTYTVTPNQ
ncbi:MAG: hypothetical protein J6V81_03805 [Bacteroidales bacterium]|nr:hypothetical protein [Bacteroidales bacterium]